MNNSIQSLKFISKSLIAFICISVTSSLLSAKDYDIASHSIEWTGSMPAKTHTGLLTPQSSEIEISDDGVIEKLKVVLDMNSINSTDLDAGKMKNKLHNHLKSEDFFYVEKYPTAQFVLTEYKGNNLVGEIEIRGVTKPISIPVEVTGDAESGWTLKGTFEIDRQNFNVNYQNGGFFGAAKDKLIRDDIGLDISLEVTPSA